MWHRETTTTFSLYLSQDGRSAGFRQSSIPFPPLAAQYPHKYDRRPPAAWLPMRPSLVYRYNMAFRYFPSMECKRAGPAEKWRSGSDPASSPQFPVLQQG